jgi:iron complex outermembrane receptor protein
MTIDRKTVTLIHTALFMSLLPVPGLGQAPTTGTSNILEELIVTAQKREQNLQDVPVAVSLLSGKAMAEAQLKNAGELATLIPTLNLQASSGPSTSSFNIRGIGTQTFSPGVDPSVSTMLDGVVMGRSGMAFLDLVDVQRVEVLRGPQGTLYGKNASGGVVHIVTKDPTPELSGTLAATAIEEGEYRVDGSVAGPITDTLGYRLTGSGISDDGYAKNYYNDKKVNDNEAFNVRGKLHCAQRTIYLAGPGPTNLVTTAITRSAIETQSGRQQRSAYVHACERLWLFPHCQLGHRGLCSDIYNRLSRLGK